MKIKNIVLASIAALLIAGISIAGTMAFFTSTETKKNTFTVGSVKITVEEPNWDPKNGNDVVPGKVIAKDPQVKNIGKNSCYVRIKLTIPEDAKGDLFELQGLNKTNWRSDGDYYYYIGSLAAGTTTQPLFTGVKLKDSITDSAALTGNQDINVISEAIQTEGFANEAAAWAAFTTK